jgi:hypothetical protein
MPPAPLRHNEKMARLRRMIAARAVVGNCLPYWVRFAKNVVFYNLE